jgi:hypothetical protein
MKMKRLVLLMLIFTLAAAPVVASDVPADQAQVVKEKEEALQTLRNENTLLRERLASLEQTPRLDAEALSLKNFNRLKEVSARVKAQQQAMGDFEAFVKWMTKNLSGYSRYIEAGSFAAGFAKVLPIPYAGQASVLTKFMSEGLLALNATSVSIAKYLATSREFTSSVDRLEKSGPAGKAAEISQAVRFADTRLLREMSEVSSRLAETANITSSTLSFLQSLEHFAGCTDQYWAKTKSLLTRSEATKVEKTYLSQSIANLKSAGEKFNARLRIFDGNARKDEPAIKSMSAYDDLITELRSTSEKRKTTAAVN